jgi:DNA-binding NtrC family response regulator
MSPPKAGERNRAPILVVDDSAFARRLVGGLIEDELGHRVIYARDGSEALVLVEESEPCVVLTDLVMPIMGGFELVEAMRQKHCHIPVVLMTAFGGESIAIRALRAGASSYVPKNNLATDLADTLRRILIAVDREHKRKRTKRSRGEENGPAWAGRWP